MRTSIASLCIINNFFISGDNAIGIIVDAIYQKFIMKPEVQEETLSNQNHC